MTIPYLMNCPHDGDGWCLGCTKEMGEELDSLRSRLAELKQERDGLMELCRVTYRSLDKSHPVAKAYRKALKLAKTGPGFLSPVDADRRIEDLAETLRDMKVWLQRHLDTGLKSRGHSDPSGHPHGYSVVEMPDWDVKQKIENIALTLCPPTEAQEPNS